MLIVFGNTRDNFIYFLYKFQSVFRRGTINNSNYYIFMSRNSNVNEKRLNSICLGNIKLWQDFIWKILVDKKSNSSTNFISVMVANKIVTLKAHVINITFFKLCLSYGKNWKLMIYIG